MTDMPNRPRRANLAALRRSSILRRSRSRNSLLMKSSPYVGWFRHAPPASSNRGGAAPTNGAVLLRQQQQHNATTARPSSSLPVRPPIDKNAFYAPSTLHMKNSPYIGWFRHAPPSRVQHLNKNGTNNKRPAVGLCQDVTDLFRTTTCRCCCSSGGKDVCSGVSLKERKLRVSRGGGNDDLREYVSGRLPGGSPLHDEAECCTIDGSENASGNNNNASTHGHSTLPPFKFLDADVSESIHRSVMLSHQQQRNDNSSSISSESGGGTADEEESATLGMLHKLANWFLFPLVHDANSCGYRHYEDAVCQRASSGFATMLFPFLGPLFRRMLLLEDGTFTNKRMLQDNNGGNNNDSENSDSRNKQDEDEYSDYSGPAAVPTEQREERETFPSPNTTTNPLEISVSSLAEAYYAHQASKEIIDLEASGSTHSSSGGNAAATTADETQHRLDYVITQMDIARMVRNASRHLDVESILSLPTVTYQSDGNPPRIPELGRTEEEGNEQQHKEGEIFEGQQEQDTNRSCGDTEEGEGNNDAAQDQGWSWMIVPPDPDDEPKNTKSTEHSSSTTTNTTRSQNQETNDDGNNNNVDQQEFCVICLEHFQRGDRLRVLPCDHMFHISCIDKWLSGTYSDEECFTSGCPTCKKSPLVDRAHEEGGREELRGPPCPDGSVPSWAFMRLGDALAKET